MSKKIDRIALTESDIDFMSEWLSKHKIKRADIGKCPAPFKKFEIEVSKVQLDDVLSKNLRILIRCVIQEESDKLDNIIKFRVRAYVDDKIVNDKTFSLRYSVVYSKEDLEDEIAFIRNVREGKIENFSTDEQNSAAAIERMEKIISDYDTAIKMGELFGIDKEVAKKKADDTFFPQLLRCLDHGKTDNIEQFETNAEFAWAVYNTTVLFMGYFKPEVMQYKRIQKETSFPKSPSKSKKKKKPQATEVSLIHISKYITDVKSGKCKMPRRKCPYAFQVRGHFRTYKSGKRVWIKEFTKGDSKNKKGRIIKLEKRKDEA